MINLQQTKEDITAFPNVPDQVSWCLYDVQKKVPNTEEKMKIRTEIRVWDVLVDEQPLLLVQTDTEKFDNVLVLKIGNQGSFFSSSTRCVELIDSLFAAIFLPYAKRNQYSAELLEFPSFVTDVS
jgi:hypothetical protein